MVKRNLLITGSLGQLGRDLISVLSGHHEITGIDIKELDICDGDRVAVFVKQIKPDIIIHTAAYTDVDGCEANRETAMAVNARGTENLARACAAFGARMIYYSTDYVFDGTKETSYVETDTPHPLTVYGQSKLEGERRVAEYLQNYIIMRIAWVYGAQGKNFVKTMLKLGKDQIEKRKQISEIAALKVVNDQFGNPTWTMDIVKQTGWLLDSDIRGIVHSTSEGVTTWYELARAIFEEADMDVAVAPCHTSEFPRPAPRPHFSALENRRLKKAGLNIMPEWRESLRKFFVQNGEIMKL